MTPTLTNQFDTLIRFAVFALIILATLIVLLCVYHFTFALITLYAHVRFKYWQLKHNLAKYQRQNIHPYADENTDRKSVNAQILDEELGKDRHNFGQHTWWPISHTTKRGDCLCFLQKHLKIITH